MQTEPVCVPVAAVAARGLESKAHSNANTPRMILGLPVPTTRECEKSIVHSFLKCLPVSSALLWNLSGQVACKGRGAGGLTLTGFSTPSYFPGPPLISLGERALEGSSSQLVGHDPFEGLEGPFHRGSLRPLKNRCLHYNSQK